MPFVLLQLSLLIHLAFYGLAQERTSAFIGVAVLIMAFVGVSLMLAWSARLRSYVDTVFERWPTLRWVTTIGMLIAVGLLCLLMPVELFYLHWLLTVYITFIAAFGIFIRPRLTLRWNTMLIGLSILALLFRLVFLQISPPIHVDEGWTFGWAYSAYRTGQLSDQIMLGWDAASYQGIPLYFRLMGAWFHLLEPSFGAARLFSLLISILTLLFTARAARVWYGQRVGGWAAFALLSSAIFLTALSTRHDVGLSFFVALCLWLYSEALHRQKAWLHFAAGAAIGAGLLSHYHAALLGVAFTIGFYAPSFILSVWRTRRPVWDGLWFGIGGGLVGLLIWAIQSAGADTVTMAGLLTTSHLLANIVLNFTLILINSTFEAVVIVVAVVLGLWRGSTRDRSLILTIILSQMILSIQLYIAPAYIAPIMPLYALLIAGLAIQAERADDSNRVSTQFLVVILLAAGFAYTLRSPVEKLLQTHSLTISPPIVEWVEENVAPDAIIIGDHAYLMWLYDYAYGSPMLSRFLVDRGLYTSLDEAWDAVQPDLFLIDSESGQYYSFQQLLADGYFAQRAYEPVAEVGSITVYAQPSALQSNQAP